MDLLRRPFRPLKRLLLGQRPFGLAKFGAGSLIERPHTFYGRRYISVGDRCLIRSHSYMQAVTEAESYAGVPRIQVGNYVYIGRYCYLVASNSISIGDGAVLSEHVYITDLNHGFDPHGGPIMQQPVQCKGPVEIGPNCFLGYRSCVMPGVSLGEWCIVGANSVVTHSFPGYSMIAGSPARLIKVYSHASRRWVTPTSVLEKG